MRARDPAREASSPASGGMETTTWAPLEDATASSNERCLDALAGQLLAARLVARHRSHGAAPPGLLPRQPRQRVATSQQVERNHDALYTSLNFIPVAPMRSKASLISSETMRAMVHPHVRKTLASSTFLGSMRMP